MIFVIICYRSYYVCHYLLFVTLFIMICDSLYIIDMCVIVYNLQFIICYLMVRVYGLDVLRLGGSICRPLSSECGTCKPVKVRFQVKVIQPFQVVPSSLESGREKIC